jgi:hypothetical protein
VILKSLNCNLISNFGVIAQMRLTLSLSRYNFNIKAFPENVFPYFLVLGANEKH